MAESVVRKHRLAERLLTDIIGLPWEKAHLEAGRWEHVISDEVEARLVEILGHPTTCPHGNPIPGSGGLEPELTALSESDRGDHVGSNGSPSRSRSISTRSPTSRPTGSCPAPKRPWRPGRRTGR